MEVWFLSYLVIRGLESWVNKNSTIDHILSFLHLSQVERLERT